MLTLANPDDSIREFLGRTYSSLPVDRRRDGKISERSLYHESLDSRRFQRYDRQQALLPSVVGTVLDRIFATEYRHMKDCIEAKLFGIGAESYTVGSYDFYLGYGVKHNKIVTLDTGHFHLTESIADKISSLLLFTPEIMLHVSRPIRWDSDHVTIMNDDTLDLAHEVVRCDAPFESTHIGLDYFDASINRIGGLCHWVAGYTEMFLASVARTACLVAQI